MKSNIISLHIPGNDANYHLIDASTFSQMKDSVILVNTARGLLVDTTELIHVLKCGKVGYAALDTFEEEKGLYYLNLEDQIIANHDRAVLSSLPNVLLSPHIAFYTAQSVSDIVENAIKGLLSFESNEMNPLEVLHE